MDKKIEKLNKIFNPKTLAVIGASNEEKTVGWGLIKNVLEGKRERKIYAVNPYCKSVLSLKCIPSIKDIKEKIDLAVIAVPARIVPQIVKECCQVKVGGIIIISAGFRESGEKGEILEEEIKKMVENEGIPLVGPNCLGIINNFSSLNATFSPGTPKKGEIAFISQSGALIDSVIDQNSLENYGFSSLISYGNGAGLNLIDFLEWLERDVNTKVICLYLEGLRGSKGILKTLKRISAKKPILALKAGKTVCGKRSALSHTCSLAGDYQIYRALFRQSGVIEVHSLKDLFVTAKALAWQPKCKNNIGIITNGGGCGVLLADYCEELEINLPLLPKKRIEKMNYLCSFQNPFDILGDALADRYKIAIDIFLKDPKISGLIIVQTLQIMTESEKNAKIIVNAKKKWKNKPIITVFLGGKSVQSGINFLEKNKIPNYNDLKSAALAIKSLIK